jgi:hypothetical protein
MWAGEGRFLWGAFIGNKLNLQAGRCSQNIVLFRLAIHCLIRCILGGKYVMGCGGYAVCEFSEMTPVFKIRSPYFVRKDTLTVCASYPR